MTRATTVEPDADPADGYEPCGVEDRYAPPAAVPDPDRDKGWFRRLLPLLLARRLAFAATLVCGVAGLTLQVSVPMVLRRAVDTALEDRTGSLEAHVWALVGIAVAAFGLRVAYRYLLFWAAYRIETDLRSTIYGHLTRLSFSFYDRVAAGEVISRANSDIRSIQLLLAFGPLAGLSMLSFVLAVGFMLTIHVPLTLVAVSTMPFVFVLGQRMRDQVFPLSWVTQGRMAEVAMVVDENLSGTRVVKSFAAEAEQITQLSRAAQRLRWSATALVDARARFNPLIEALPRLGMALILLYGGWLAIEGDIGVGALLAFSSYVVVLDGLDLVVEPGETVALVGRTGCGKTTVARLLCRFYDVDAGAVLVDDNDVRDLTLTSLRHHANQVTDEPFLFSESIRDNIAFGRPDAPHEDVVRAAEAAQADTFVGELAGGWDEVVGERGYTLSGGQRQRIALARSLLANPRILVLDDATSAVDVRVEEAIHAALRDLLADRTTIVIAHRLSTIALADRVVLLEGGRITASGTHAELLATSPAYAAILASGGNGHDDPGGQEAT